MPLFKGFNMPTQIKTEANVQQAVPFFGVTNMEASLRFYVDGLGFEMTNKWTPDGDGRVRWCWLQYGNAAIMLQEYQASKKPEGKLGLGITICFQCKDALAIYGEFMDAELRRKGLSSGMDCGSLQCKIPTATNLSLRAPRTRLKSRCSLRRSGSRIKFRNRISVQKQEIGPCRSQV